MQHPCILMYCNNYVKRRSLKAYGKMWWMCVKKPQLAVAPWCISPNMQCMCITSSLFTCFLWWTPVGWRCPGFCIKQPSAVSPRSEWEGLETTGEVSAAGLLPEEGLGDLLVLASLSGVALASKWHASYVGAVLCQHSTSVCGCGLLHWECCFYTCVSPSVLVHLRDRIEPLRWLNNENPCLKCKEKQQDKHFKNICIKLQECTFYIIDNIKNKINLLHTIKYRISTFFFKTTGSLISGRTPVHVLIFPLLEEDMQRGHCFFP